MFKVANNGDCNAAFLVTALRGVTGDVSRSPLGGRARHVGRAGETWQALPPQVGTPPCWREAAARWVFRGSCPPAAPRVRGSGVPLLPRASRQGCSVLNEKNWGWLLEGVFTCKAFKKCLACFRRPVCAKRHKELFCQRIISQSGGFPVERRMKCTVLYPCKQAEERERRDKSREMGLPTRSGAAQAL